MVPPRSGPAQLSGGVATFTTSTPLTVASHNITVVYATDGNFLASTSPILTEMVQQDGTTTSLTSSANPSVFGQSVTFTATVSPASPGVVTPAGTVTFYDGTTSLGNGTLCGGVATLSTAKLAVGAHPITAVYNGNANFIASTSAVVPQTVNQAGTNSAVTASVNPSVTGQSLTLTATVSAAAPAPARRPGPSTSTTVRHLIGGPVTLNATAKATLSTSFSTAAVHNITVQYSGDGNFLGDTSTVLAQAVNPASTKTVVASSANPSVFGQSVTFTATVTAVSPGSGTPSDGDTVTFIDGVTTIGTGTLSGGVATYITSSLSVSTHTISAVFGGDANYPTSTSASINQKVNQASTTTTVMSSLNPSVLGQSVTFTATVAAVSPGSGTPTGTVTFKDGTKVIGGGTLNAHRGRLHDDLDARPWGRTRSRSSTAATRISRRAPQRP